MTLRLEEINIDAHEPQTLARWWAELLRWTVTSPDTELDYVSVEGPDGAPELLFARVPEDKRVKNRVHLDFRPDDQTAEVARAEAMGATRIDVGQGEQTWVVLADPEGNEFCILRSAQ